jgi:hypothetical protein
MIDKGKYEIIKDNKLSNTGNTHHVPVFSKSSNTHKTRYVLDEKDLQKTSMLEGRKQLGYY